MFGHTLSYDQLRDRSMLRSDGKRVGLNFVNRGKLTEGAMVGTTFDVNIPN